MSVSDFWKPHGVALGIGGAAALPRDEGSAISCQRDRSRNVRGIALLFILVAIAASYIPARRATRIDPMTALRVD